MSTSTINNWATTRQFLFSWKGLVATVAISYFSFKEVSFQVGDLPELVTTESSVSIAVPQEMSYTASAQPLSSVVRDLSTTIKNTPPPAKASTATKAAPSSSISSNLANTYSNLTYTEPKLANSPNSGNVSSGVAAKRKKQRAYVNRYADAAIQEMHKYGIPASITLAQGLIESNCGESKLATRNNNHFGIKCFSRSCKKGHCSNFTDDTHKDFFRIYESTWESYRGHSILLQKDRYKSLYKLPKTDYKNWARGLKKAGYATDPLYGEKLINLIEALDLQEYDRK
jgi:flagellum-specific peptidoglycan hydrolase FlgJ